MANTSLKAALERFWQHIIAALGGKANVDHTHSAQDLSGVVKGTEIYDLDSWTYGCYKRTTEDENYMYGSREEWLNPPLREGELYPTMERFGGCPVYKLAFGNGLQPISGGETVTIPAVIPFGCEIVEITGATYNLATELYGGVDEHLIIQTPTNSTNTSYRDIKITNNGQDDLGVYLTFKIADFS